MTTIMLKAIAQYQCPGCVHGVSPKTCSKLKETPDGCAKQELKASPDERYMAPALPAGFCQLGKDSRTVEVYESFDTMVERHPNLTTIFSRPVWKHLDKLGNTLVRWYSPRINKGWVTVTLGDCRDRFPDTREITNEDLAELA